MQKIAPGNSVTQEGIMSKTRTGASREGTTSGTMSSQGYQDAFCVKNTSESNHHAKSPCSR
eukprot:1182397-Prorocentrum_lima.AAC.1